ncbi:MAG: hypothetical protein SWH61_09585 [Thermodesulfobacteriota bacterium]|nr:hypothetical protein [Thermodesulfobacteriota bacterium]
MKKLVLLTGAIILFASPLFADSGYGRDRVQIHGFISQGYIQSSANDFYLADTDRGTFEYNEMGINFSSVISDDLRVGVQFLSRDLGDIGNNEIDVDWAYGDYNYRNWLGLRVGKFKQPIALFNQYRDIDATRTCIFLPPTMIYREDFRDTNLATRGAGIYGTLAGGLEYQAFYGVMEIDDDGGVVRVLSDALKAQYGGGVETDVATTEVDPTYGIWLNWNTPLSGLSVGGNYGNFDLDLDAKVINPVPVGGGAYMNTYFPLSYTLYGDVTRVFSQYRYNDLMLAGEYGWFETNTEATGPGVRTKAETDAIDWYLMATYRVSPWFELGTYYTEMYREEDDKDGAIFILQGQPREKAWRKDWAVSTRFDITMNWIFKLEAHFMDGLLHVDYGNETDPSDKWQMYAAKLTYTF